MKDTKSKAVQKACESQLQNPANPEYWGSAIARHAGLSS